MRPITWTAREEEPGQFTQILSPASEWHYEVKTTTFVWGWLLESAQEEADDQDRAVQITCLHLNGETIVTLVNPSVDEKIAALFAQVAEDAET